MTMEVADKAASSVGSGTEGREIDASASLDVRMSSSERVVLSIWDDVESLKVEGIDNVGVDLNTAALDVVEPDTVGRDADGMDADELGADDEREADRLDAELLRDMLVVDIVLTFIVSACPFSTTAAQILATCGSTHCLRASPNGLPTTRARRLGMCDAPRQRGSTYGLALLHLRRVLSVADRMYGSALTLYSATTSDACRTYGPKVTSYSCSNRWM
jgi:hypothetical protein